MTSTLFYCLPPLIHYDNAFKGDVTSAGTEENPGIWQVLTPYDEQIKED
jgi:hypothetical protein